VIFHPVADAFKDTRRNVFFQEGHAAALADLIAEVSAERGACRGEQDEQDPAVMLGGENDDHDVGDARQGQRDEGAVDDGDEEDAEDAEAEEKVEEGVTGLTTNDRGFGSDCCEVFRRGEDSREELHT
jgi:hypothetical protein